MGRDGQGGHCPGPDLSSAALAGRVSESWASHLYTVRLLARGGSDAVCLIHSLPPIVAQSPALWDNKYTFGFSPWFLAETTVPGTRHGVPQNPGIS